MTTTIWFLLRKVAALAITLLIASFAIFSALFLAPGDPASLLGGKDADPATIAAIRRQLGLDDPFLLQYGRWLGDLLAGDMGRSYAYRADIADLIAPRIGTTFLLVAYAALIILILGIGSGILAALANKRTDRAVTVITSTLMGAPTFVIAIILITVFSLYLTWFPVFGNGTNFPDQIRHLTLPAIAMSCAYLAFVSRITRSAVRAEMYSEHVDTARSRGLAPSYYIPHHVLRNASSQIFAVSGITIAGLFASTAIAEQAFGINGIGSLLVTAASRQDLPVVQVLCLFLVTAFVIVNVIVDVVNAVIDPRIARKEAI
ncbi:ABC transporter permease [Arthrobacter sp. S2(2024)]|uniref:ABC transporter permease n=1 Tax=Arthrobacter sp. S2(2024) TaxID=3111911 RepID=UPI002FC70240